MHRDRSLGIAPNQHFALAVITTDANGSTDQAPRRPLATGANHAPDKARQRIRIFRDACMLCANRTGTTRQAPAFLQTLRAHGLLIALAACRCRQRSHPGLAFKVIARDAFNIEILDQADLTHTRSKGLPLAQLPARTGTAQNAALFPKPPSAPTGKYR